MSKGTILYLGGFELPDKNAAAQRVISNGKLLRDLGYKVVFCGMNKEGVKAKLDTPEKQFNFESYALKYPSNNIEWFKYIIEYKYYRSIIDRQTNMKAIICYNLPSGSLFRLKKFGKRKNIKIISDCTEWYEAPKDGSFASRNIKRLDIFLRMRKLHFSLDGIISISELLHRYYATNNQKTIKVPPLVDINDSKWGNEITITQRPIQFVYSGSPFSLTSKASVKDRLDLIISAMAEMKKAQKIFYLHIVGIEYENFIEIYPTLKDELLLLKDSISFYGRVPHSRSIALLKNSDFSIFIRDTNIVTKAGFPTKFVESISCGIPVITNNSSNIEDYLEDGKNGFWVAQNDKDGIGASLEKAIALSPEEIYQMKMNCRSSQVFDYHNFTEDFEYLLQ